jgi:antitoxin ParD1/3/4
MVEQNIVLTEGEKAELRKLRERLMEGLEQAQRGEFAEGSGEDAIRRAFAAGREPKQP